MGPIRALAVACLLATTAACSTPPPEDAATGCPPDGLLNIGEELPECTFEGLPGHEDVVLARLKGTPTVINFWAEWCPNCVKEMPAFQRVAGDLEGRVRFVGMDLLGVQGETKQAATTFASRVGVTYALAYDPGAEFYGHFAQRSARPVLPVTIFVDAENVVRARRFGEMNERELRSQIRESLGIS